MTLDCTVDDFDLTLPASRFIADFCQPERFMECCRACPNFGAIWACPPFDSDILASLRRYSQVTVYVTRITPVQTALPLSCAWNLMRPERERIEARLLALEKATAGRAFAHAGCCLHCPEELCTRPAGLPCRHPDKVRPALEAVGFDLGKTTAELFGLPMQWGTAGKLPDYLLLVTALFHN